MRRGFKAWAEKVATEQRRNLNLSEISPLPARVLAEHLEVTISVPSEIPGIPQNILHQLQIADHRSWSAITLEHKNCTVIICNPVHSPRRQESNIMHELAHVLCGHEYSNMIRLDIFPFPIRSYDPVQEDEAKWLGGCLQIPRPALLWAIDKGMNDAAMAQYFSASIKLVRYRRQITGVDRQMFRRYR